MMFPPPSSIEEERLRAQGYQLIAGIDEVGRGALAGPVASAAVILPHPFNAPWLGLVRDSKQLTPARRQFLSDKIQEKALAIGIGMVSPELVDAQGIIGATRSAMQLAVEQLPSRPHFLLIDYLRLPDLPLPQKGIKHGDRLCLSIACASIIAKVARDRLMVELDNLCPGYGFSRHKGYATAEHLANLQRAGPSPVHRRSFVPVKEMVFSR
jgi:ribonuclease HII